MKDVLLQLHAAAPFERTTGPAYRWDNRSRPVPGLILQYTWSGEGRLKRGDRTLSCRPGQALIMRQGDPTTYFYPPEGWIAWEYTWINFAGAEALWGEFIRHHGDVVSLDPEGETVATLKQVTHLYQTKGFLDRYHTSELLGRLLAALARELGRTTTADRSPIHQAQDHLRDHHRRPINIKEVAARFDFSREHFSRLYHRETGETPAAFLRQLRLQTARRLLRETVMPVREVAEQSGFGSSTHFCRAFRMAEKMSPEAYRECNR